MVFELLNPELQKIIQKRFVQPTLTQKLAIPKILEGKNVLIVAPVASGKTESAIFPLLSKIMQEKSNPISILYISPLKSLNRDLLDRLIWWGDQTGIETSVRHGDTSQYERKLQLEFPPTLLILTLETLQPILTAKRFREHLKNVKWVILDECLPYDTMITLSDGSHKKIGDIVEENLPKGLYEYNCEEDIFVKSFDKKNGELLDSKILKVHKIPLHTDMIYIRTKFYTIELSTTSNHPILVFRDKKLEWINANDIKLSDKLVVFNPIDTNSIKPKNKKKTSLVIDESYFKETYLKLFLSNNKDTGGQRKKLENTIKKLKEKGILPLYSDNSKLPLLSRIIGHMFGDGWLTITKSTVATGFSAPIYDLEEIKKDVSNLGFKLGPPATRETTSSIEYGMKNVKGTSNQMSNGSKSLAALLVALGVPYGDKTNEDYTIPNWIINGSTDVKKEFLSSFIGSGMSLPSGRMHLDFNAARISINKREDLIDAGLKLAKDLEKIFNEFGVKFSDISIKNGNTRKDGTRTKKIVITISNEEKNLINLLKLGVNYNHVKNEFFTLISEYIRAKEFARLNKNKFVKKIKDLKRKGYKDAEIGRLLGFDKQLNSRGKPYGNQCSDIIRRILRPTKRLLIGFPDLNEWTKLRIQDCLLDEIAVIKKEGNGPCFVYDLTVDKTHNFLANNIVVHNCHEIADSKRGVQLTLALERLRELCGNFQLIMLSATIGEPEKVAKFFSGGREVEIVKASFAKQMEINVINPRPMPIDRKNAEKIFSSVETAARLRKIMELIKSSRSTLAFTNTREFAEILASRIKTLDKKFPAGVHHSSLSKEIRIKTEKEFKEEKLKSIISTSSLQLGIDIGSVDLVLQYMSPRQITQAIQKIGRSGHALEKISRGIIISTDEDDIFESAVIAKKALNEELEPLGFHENCLDVLAHQLVGLTLEYWKIDLQKAYEIVRRAWPYHNLSYKEFLSVCDQLQNLGLVFLNSEIKKKRRGFEYYFSQLSTIPSLKQYKIFNTLDNSFVGVLDEEFVALHGEPGTSFIVKGEAWRIIDVSEDKVLVEPTVDIEAAIPAWEGELIPVPFEVAQEVGRLRAKIAEYLGQMSHEKIVLELQKLYPIDDNCANKMINLIKKQLKYGMVPDDKTILIEDFDNFVVIHSCFGTKTNETLGRFISSLLTVRIGSVGLRTDPYRIMIQFQQKNPDLIKEILFNVKPEHLKDYLELSLAKSELFEWKFVHVAKRFGAIARDAEYGKVRMKRIIEDYVGTPIFKETLKELETEKLDVERATEILKRIQNGEIRIVFKPGVSPLGKIGLRHELTELVGPTRPELEIFKLFKKRLLNTSVKLVCVNCGQWQQSFVVKELPERVKCGKCGARLLAVVHPRDMDAIKLVKKKLRGRLEEGEKRRFERVMQAADLFLVYDKKAAVALAARGVGPETAKRILARFHRDEDDFLRDILEAERKFIQTRKYWSS